MIWLALILEAATRRSCPFRSPTFPAPKLALTRADCGGGRLRIGWLFVRLPSPPPACGRR